DDPFEANGEQDGDADQLQESLFEPVIASGHAPIALGSCDEVFYPMTTPVDRCGEWHSHSAVTATRNAGVYSFSGPCLPEGRAIIGFVANEGRMFWQRLRELFCQRDVGLVPTGQGNDDSLRARIDDGMNLGV